MARDVINNDLLVNGILTPTAINLPDGGITDAKIATAAAVSATKLQHQHQPVYAQPGGADSITERKVIHVVRGATGTIVAFSAGVRTANTGNSTVTVDLLKNGTTVLSAAIVLDSTNAAYAEEAGTISSAGLVAGDTLEVNVTAAVGTGTLGDGAYAMAVIREDAD